MYDLGFLLLLFHSSFLIMLQCKVLSFSYNCHTAGVTYVCMKMFQISYVFIHTTYNWLCLKVSCIICISSCFTNGNEADIYIKQITNLATIRAVTKRHVFGRYFWNNITCTYPCFLKNQIKKFLIGTLVQAVIY